jgi:hypothetical protein
MTAAVVIGADFGGLALAIAGIDGSTGGGALATFPLPRWGAMDSHRRGGGGGAAPPPPETLADDGSTDRGTA